MLDAIQDTTYFLPLQLPFLLLKEFLGDVDAAEALARVSPLRLGGDGIFAGSAPRHRSGMFLSTFSCHGRRASGARWPSDALRPRCTVLLLEAQPMPSLFSMTRIGIYTEVCKANDSQAKSAGSIPDCPELSTDCAGGGGQATHKCQRTAPELVNGFVVLCRSQCSKAGGCLLASQHAASDGGLVTAAYPPCSQLQVEVTAVSQT